MTTTPVTQSLLPVTPEPWCIHCGCKEKDHESDGTCLFPPSRKKWTPEGQAHSLPGDVGMREALEEIASVITPGNFWHARTIGDLSGWCDRLQTRIRALAALTHSALSGDAGEG